jgi:DNA-directed RNA polymerase subunit K/omega
MEHSFSIIARDLKNSDGDKLFDKLGEKVKVVPKDERETLDILTRYEMAAVLGFRAEMIENLPSVHEAYKDVPFDNAYDMAVYELKKGILPLSIVRHVGNVVEIFDVSELAVVDF